MSWRKTLKNLAVPGTKVAMSEVPIGGATFAGAFVVTQPSAGHYVAFVRNCPHQGRQVDSADDSGLRCPAHGSVFDLQTGMPLRGPACEGLRQAKITALDDQLVLTR